MPSFNPIIHFSNRLYSLCISYKNFACCMPCSSYYPLFFCSNNILWILLEVTHITHYWTSRIYKNILASWQPINSLFEHHKYLFAGYITNAINNKFLAWNKFITSQEHVLASPVHNKLYSRFRGYWLQR